MDNYLCKFCQKPFSNPQSMGAHTVNCQENPKRSKNLAKSKKFRRAKLQVINPKKVYKLVCKICGGNFNREMTLSTYQKNRVPLCSRSCASSYVGRVSKEKKIKSLKSTMKAKGFKVTPQKTSCAYCGDLFSYKSGKKYCGSSCKEKSRKNALLQKYAAAEIPFEGLYLKGPYFNKSIGRYTIQLVELGVEKPKLTLTYARYLMSVKEGRRLDRSEEVDHIDTDKTNDAIHNLQILSTKDHEKKTAIEKYAKTKRYKVQCEYCGKWIIRREKELPGKGHAVKFNVCSNSCKGKVVTTKILKGVPLNTFS